MIVDETYTKDEQFEPANSSDAEAVLCKYCERCSKDALLNGTMDPDDREIDDNLCGWLCISNPEVWRIDGRTGLPYCADFDKLPDEPPLRCPLTVDMFEEQAA